MLSLQHLHKRYGDVVALDGASFDVPPGRIVGFLGPNGAGKTTAMRCIFGLVKLDAGEVIWDGAPAGPAAWLRFGYMPEERGLYPKMRIGEQLAYFGRLSGLGRSAAGDAASVWLQRFGLADRADDRVEQLSHGNQQRIQLATALVHEPVVAVLDEPFAGLDPIGMETMSTTLRDLAAGGTAIVFSSHQLDLVEDVCEDVVIIDQGRIRLAGSLSALRARSDRRHLEVAVDGRPWAPDLDGVTTIGTGDRRRYLVDRAAPIEEILARARTEGEVTRFTFEPPSLSDLFREAVGP